jgi:hypothetical protein
MPVVGQSRAQPGLDLLDANRIRSGRGAEDVERRLHQREFGGQLVRVGIVGLHLGLDLKRRLERPSRGERCGPVGVRVLGHDGRSSARRRCGIGHVPVRRR